MTRTVFTLGLFGVAFLTLSAQQPQKPNDLIIAARQAASGRVGAISEANLVATGGLNCPVLASAERCGGGAVVQTHKAAPASPVTELHMQFAPTRREGIAAATIMLHGTDAQPRAELAYSSAKSHLSEEFHLTGSPGHSLSKADVFPSRVANVRWIDLSELKFTDGSTWHSSDTSYCHIQPNGFMRVAAD